jgi:hypothetical protein
MHLTLGTCLLALLSSALPALAQVDRATVTGAVHDASGAAVASATVTLTYPATGLARPVTSNEQGIYFVTGLPVGSAVVLVEKDGFRPIRVDADLTVGETRTLDFSLDIAGVESSVEVVAPVALVHNSAGVGAVLENRQVSQLPINGRNWGNLMALVPGAVDTGGNGSAIRFVGHGGDDNNFRIDGVDATSVRNQSQSKSRLLISTDAISEFRVTSALYSAESGGSSGGQIEIVTKAGANEMRGGLFEYFRNSALDARSPFDGATLPEFHLNQFGGTIGGPVLHDRTFFFASYEGLNQRQGRTQIGFVPSAAFRAGVVPALKPIIDAYPLGQTAVNANVSQWTGVDFATQREHVGLLRVDHRITDKLSTYVRVSKNATDIFTPSATLPVGGTQNPDAPTSGLVDLLYLPSSRTTNELRIGFNYSEPLNSTTTGGANIAISVPSFSTLPAQTFRVAIGKTQSIVDQWATFRGAHTIKAGVDVRHVQLRIHDGANAQAGTLTYASLADFQANKLNTAEYSAELPTKELRKLQYFGYVQDEWKMTPTLSANLGLRYEYYGVFNEIHGLAIPFDINACGGYCAPGSTFAYPDRNNFAPRVSFAWAPSRFHDRTVISVGAGVYYGDAQLGDQYNPANNDTQRFTYSRATTPSLAYPIDSLLNPTLALATAPRSMPLDKKNEESEQWGLSLQQAVTNRVSFVVGYNGQKNTHVFSRTYVNVINPATGTRPLPGLDQIDVRGEDGNANFNGLTTTLRLNNWHGLSATANYMLSHATDDGSSGGGGASPAQNVACQSCEWGDSSVDVRHVFTSYFVYELPFLRHNAFLGGWQWTGIATARGGLPINVTVTRKAADMPDGNTLSSLRPNLVPGVPLYLDYATTGLWLNSAAFAVPAAGTWGNLPRNAVRGPALVQFDTALAKRIRVSGRTGLEFGIQVFNVFNRPQLGSPNSNISSASFGRITSLLNSSPVGVGTPRQMQLEMRVSF